MMNNFCFSIQLSPMNRTRNSTADANARCDEFGTESKLTLNFFLSFFFIRMFGSVYHINLLKTKIYRVRPSGIIY